MSFLRTFTPISGLKTDSHSDIGIAPTRVIRSDGFYDSAPPFAFFPDGGCLTVKSGGFHERSVILSAVEDDQQFKLGSIVADHHVVSILLSNDGRWIVLGGLPYPGGHRKDMLATIWNAKTHKKMMEIKYDEPDWNGQLVDRAVDISPDSSRFTMSSKTGLSLCVWSITTGERLLGPLKFQEAAYAKHVKFSPSGDRLAIATTRGVVDSPSQFYVYDSRTGDILNQISGVDVSCMSWHNDDRHLFAAINDKLQRLDIPPSPSESSHGVVTIESAICGTNVALASHGQFLASLDKDGSIMFWDTSTLTQIGPAINYGRADAKPSSIMLSGCNAYLAGITRGLKKTIVIWSLREILPEFYFMVIPFINPSEKAFTHWVHSDLLATDATLSEELEIMRGPTHDTLASRALVRTRLRRWREAYDDAESSLAASSYASVAAHIAKALALTGLEQYDSAMWHFDLVFRDSNSNEHELLWLLKCIITSISGRHDLAILRVSELVVRANDKVLHYLVQAKMQDCLGNNYMSQGESRRALESFEQAVQLHRRTEPLDPAYLATPVLQFIYFTFGWQFKTLNMDSQTHRCDALLATGKVKDAAESLSHIVAAFDQEIKTDEKMSNFVIELKRRSAMGFESLGDEALDASNFHEAEKLYTDGLSVEPPSPYNLFIKRSKVRTEIGMWQKALEDADHAVALDPLSPWGYERKMAALYGLHRHDEAIEAMNVMLSKLTSASDPRSWSLREQGINPEQMTAIVSAVVADTLRRSPLVLIDTESGRLCNKSLQTRAFQACPKFKDLVLLVFPPSQLDHETIRQTVMEYFRYTTLSHTWDAGEPLFHDVLPVSVYGLPASPTNTKLQRFCGTSYNAGFKWSWSDTCCIDKRDSPVLQESLVSMYQWYRESSLTLVHLKGVLSTVDANSDLDPLLDALARCIWNTRAWTLQEYFASTVIRFYTQDWKPYLTGTDIANDKLHPFVLRQMSIATGVDTHVLTSLRAGSDHVREKLRLASNRIATRQEDTAYSLFGILGVSIPAIYGEGHKSLGRLLEAVLHRSGDSTILAWTGRASDYNSSLPAEIAAYAKDITSFIPSPIERGQLETMTSGVRLSSIHQESAVEFYDRVVDLPSPRLVNGRLNLSSIIFPLAPLMEMSTGGNATDGQAHLYTTTASALGKIEIKTTDEVADLENLVLVHPWLESLLDPLFMSPRFNVDEHSHSGQLTKLTKALRLLVRLRQPFGALLLAPLNHREYKRIATDHGISVQIRDDIPLQELLGMVEINVLDVL